MNNRKMPGFTDRLGIYCIALLTVGLIMAYSLGVKSIDADYQGALACFTIVFTPIGTALGITLTAIVNKNRAENTDGGINAIKAQQGFGSTPPEI